MFLATTSPPVLALWCNAPCVLHLLPPLSPKGSKCLGCQETMWHCWQNTVLCTLSVWQNPFSSV
ncbi:hypothetical protein XENTR_v10014630 [Xenopus tropicalis]|nr:hypothetical protein XENTR_v10014630 [Xenopus tropicalis]